MNIFDIDFGQRYRDHMAAAGGREKPPEAWDAQAAGMARQMQESPYAHAFVERMDLSAVTTLLDVGCGTGTIALALAGRMERVYGLDYSAGMLAVLMENAALRQFTNVEPILRAWEDDWSDVPACDVVVASRSSSVMDMADALAKLDAKAKRRVYLTSLVGGLFIDPGILELLDRRPPPLPDYIYILNILYQMGRHPRVDYIETDSRLANTESFDVFARKLTHSVGELSDAERTRLAAWYDADPVRARRGGAPFRWAFISWETR
ncbi:class I SAM-dependent methyltransferase [Thiobacillus sp.]